MKSITEVHFTGTSFHKNCQRILSSSGLIAREIEEVRKAGNEKPGHWFADATIPAAGGES
jgi:hypothetical protein